MLVTCSYQSLSFWVLVLAVILTKLEENLPDVTNCSPVERSASAGGRLSIFEGLYAVAG